jgi:hypothetical protein
MNYPKEVMTIKELTKMGYPEEWLRTIYRSRAINRDHSIAWKMGGEDKRNSPILFDTEALEKYRRTLCTGV